MSNRTDTHTPGLPGAPLARRWAAFVGIAAALVAVPPGATAGAQGAGAMTRQTTIADVDGNPVPLPQQRGFNMFAEADVAASGMRMTGIYGWQIPNAGGPCPWYFTNNSE